MVTNCNLSSLAEYTPSESKPWDKQRAQHLYRRLTYGATPSLINISLQQSPTAIVDLLVDEALNVPVSTPPDWVNITKNEIEAQELDFDEVNGEYKDEWYLQTMYDQENNGLRALLTIFWHNHFVTEINTYRCAGYMVEYYNVLQEYALGNFKDFVRRIGLTHAMLTYLDGVDNNANRPNDNYARELYELFTLGENNGYTEDDIADTAKALTGYNNKNNEDLNAEGDKNACTLITFSPETFNTDTKTIFGQTGNFDYDDVIDILFEQRTDLIAEFIVGKLYKFFVSPTLNEVIVLELANEFKVDFELEPILRKLLKSEHFFDEEALATIIKSPYDLHMNLIKVMNIDLTDEERGTIFSRNGQMGQSFYQPIDVAGWQADYDWINSATLVGRWEYIQQRITAIFTENPEKLRDFAKEASDNSDDVAVVVRRIIDTFVPRGLNTEQDYEIALDDFKGEVPDSYFVDGTWTLDFETVPRQMVQLFQFLVYSPEFQLK